MKRDKNLHPLSWDHHAALTSVVFTRKHIKVGADRERLEQVAREFAVFHQDALLPHFRHEEEWLLPRYLRHVSADDPDLIRLLTDHIVLHKLILDLGHAVRDGGELVPALTALADHLEAHVRFEERELFPKIEAALTADELRDLGEQFWADAQEAIVIPGGDGCRVKISGMDSPETG
jgi:iron-sulfur cluster repair protein YtfE (RIC family)